MKPPANWIEWQGGRIVRQRAYREWTPAPPMQQAALEPRKVSRGVKADQAALDL